MENLTLTRSYLETLSSADLIDLADEYGVDIPDGLNRRFIIGELIDVIDILYDEMVQEEKNSVSLSENNSVYKEFFLPKTYNETAITVLLRNPSWIFVFWDINKCDIKKNLSQKNVTLMLRLGYYYADTEKPTEYFGIPANIQDRDLNILVSKKCYAVCVDLVVENKNQNPQILAHSNKIVMPPILPKVASWKISAETSPILLLAGMESLWYSHYFAHCQSRL